MSDDVVPVLDPLPVEPGPVRRGWFSSGLVALAIMVCTLGLSVPGLAITMLLGYTMAFAGPVYAVFYVPIVVSKWRRRDDENENDAETDGAVSAIRDLTGGFGTLNQKLTIMLSAILSVNLLVFVASYLTNGNSDLMIACGLVAVAIGVPIFVLNLIWIQRPHGIAGESIAVRNRVGAWRLISTSRVLSLLIWCGYPLVSIIGIAVTL